MNFSPLLVTAVLFALPAEADTVYVSELYNPAVNGPAILRFDSAGNSSVFGYSGLSGPNGLAFDKNGTLYVASYGNNTIETFDSSGNASVFAAAGLNQPHVLAFDPFGNLYVANDANGQGYIEKFDPSGHGSLFATGLYDPQGITCDSSGNVYVSTWINNQTALAVLKYTTNGQHVVFTPWNKPGIPRGLAYYNNFIYCTDGNSLDKINLTGQMTVLATAGLTNSIGVAVDSSGNCYVTDQMNEYVMEYDPSGHGTLFASGFANDGLTYVTTEVPEPAAAILLVGGVAWLLARAIKPGLLGTHHVEFQQVSTGHRASTR